MPTAVTPPSVKSWTPRDPPTNQVEEHWLIQDGQLWLPPGTDTANELVKAINILMQSPNTSREVTYRHERFYQACLVVMSVGGYRISQNVQHPITGLRTVPWSHFGFDEATLTQNTIGSTEYPHGMVIPLKLKVFRARLNDWHYHRARFETGRLLEEIELDDDDTLAADFHPLRTLWEAATHVSEIMGMRMYEVPSQEARPLGTGHGFKLIQWLGEDIARLDL